MRTPRPLRAFVEVVLGRQRSPQHETGQFMVPYLRAANVKDGELDLSDVKFMNFGPAEQRLFGLRPGDVLVTEGSGSLATVGASATWAGDMSGTVCFQNTLIRLRPRSEATDQRFLAWWARYAFAAGVFARIASGANIFHISADRVRALQVTFPRLADQRAIANFLDTETSRIETLINKKRQVVSLLDEREASVVTHAFGDQLRRRSSDLTKGIGDAMTPPLGRVALVQSGLTLDAARDPGDSPVTLPYLRVANVQAGRLDLAELKEVTVSSRMAARCQLRPGDVLMTEGGDVDKLGRGAVWPGEIEPCLHQNHIFAVRPDREKLRSDYLSALLQTSYAKSYFEMTATKTTGIASTSASKIAAFRVPLLPVAEQKSIVQQIKSANGRLDNLRSRLTAQIELLREHRSALITAAVTSQLTQVRTDL